MDKKLFRGSAVALVTPFKNNGMDINYDKVEELIEYHINNKTDALVIAGTTGEAATLEYNEHEKLLKFAVNYANGRIPIIAGTGSNNTKRAIELTKKAESYGADIALSVTPYYNKCSKAGLIKHYEMIANSVNIPIILYNVPSRTGGVNITPDVAEYLSQIDNIVGLKEASANLEQVKETILKTLGNNFNVYSGNDDQTVDIINLGGKGVVSVLANICPLNTHMMCEHALNGNVKEALKMQKEYLELIKTLFCEVNPIPVKECMNYLGWEVGDLRMPLLELNREEEKFKGLVKTLRKYKENDLLK